MKSLAFLSADHLKDYVIDDDLAYLPLRNLGWEVKTISWRNDKVDWSQFECAIIRSTWDYQRDLPGFLVTMADIAKATRLANPIEIVRWNAEKTYLRELENRGARVVPTIWKKAGADEAEIDLSFDEFETSHLVLKPTISANAENTMRLTRGSTHDISMFAARSYMVQPFMRGIVEEGEFSLFYFNREFSHAILKKPKPKDFRVQEEHGGTILGIEPPPDLLAAGDRVMDLLDSSLLYARVDFVRDGDAFLLMELELIEPSLYLRMDENAPRRFARAIDQWPLR
ncbi:MAG: hypothetical protein M3119_07125 [Verrucomicrobiota bacterium]|nr:hypothetical protein [Verrucomicrobiota bacterium]